MWLKKNFWSREKTSKEQLVILNNFLEFLFLTLHVTLNHRKEKNNGLHHRGECMATPEGTELMTELHVLGTKTTPSPTYDPCRSL